MEYCWTLIERAETFPFVRSVCSLINFLIVLVIERGKLRWEFRIGPWLTFFNDTLHFCNFGFEKLLVALDDAG